MVVKSLTPSCLKRPLKDRTGMPENELAAIWNKEMPELLLPGTGYTREAHLHENMRYMWMFWLAVIL